MSKQLGVVRAWNQQKGFGFLRMAEVTFDWLSPIGRRQTADSGIRLKKILAEQGKRWRRQ